MKKLADLLEKQPTPGTAEHLKWQTDIDRLSMINSDELIALTKEIVDRVMAVDMRVAMEGIYDVNREIILAELQAIRKMTRYGMLLATATTQPN